MARNDSIVVERQPTPFERLVGECAAEIFMDEVDISLKEVDWADLEDISLDDWFWKTLTENTSKPERVRPQRSLARRMLLYAASFIAFLIVTGVIVLATVEPARAAFRRFLVTRFPQYSEYIIQLYPDDEIARLKFVLPAYIPVGFQLEDESQYDNWMSMYWMDDAKERFISYEQTGIDSPLSLDTEGASILPLQINGVEGELIQKGNLTTIQFFRDDACYVIITNLSKEECVGIAESIPLE